MAAGIQVWDAQGRNLLDTNDRVGRLLGVVREVTSNGSRSVAGFSQGIPFATFTLSSVESRLTSADYPRLTVSGNTLSWAFGTRYNGNAKIDIYYGVY